MLEGLSEDEIRGVESYMRPWDGRPVSLERSVEEALAEHPDARWENGKIVLDTEEIVLPYYGNEYSVGRLTVRLDPRLITTNQYYSLSVERITGPIRDLEFIHPHIRQNVICFGESWYAIARGLNDGRFGDVLSMVQSFLRTVVPGDDWYEIGLWIPEDQRPTCGECGRVMKMAGKVCTRCAIAQRLKDSQDSLKT